MRVLLVLLAVMPSGGGAQSIFHGENVLAFAERLQAGATPAAVYATLDGVFERLGLAADRRERHVHLKSVQIQRLSGGAEVPSATSAILLSAGSVKIGKADRVLIVAEGDVEIADARNVVVVSRGRVRIGREMDPGIYLSRRMISVANGVSPIVYAVEGATVNSREPFIAYNTAVKIDGGFLAYQFTRASLFQGEPIRQPAEGQMTVNSGESMPFAGARCATAIADDVNLLSQLLPWARKRANCPKVDAATVSCEQEERGAAPTASKERWTLQLCGKPMTLLVQSERTGKITATGQPDYDHSIVVQTGAAPDRARSPLPTRPTAFAAEDALALAGVAEAQLRRDRVVQAIQRILDALQLPTELRSKYAFLGSADLRVEPGYAELTQLYESILVADGAVKVSFARNAVIVARGPVEVAHGGGLIVVAEGPVKLSHESGVLGAPFVPGVYVTRGTFEGGISSGSVIYALQGAQPAYGGMTLINTNFKPNPNYAAPVSYTVPPLYRGEPPRAAIARPPPAAAPFAYGGERCPDAMPGEIALLARMRSLAQKEAKCSAIASVAVKCAQAAAPTNGFRSIERWTFDLCEQKLTVVSSVEGYVPQKPGSSSASAVNTSMTIERSATSAEDMMRRWNERSARLSPGERAKYQELVSEVGKLSRHGYLVEARDKQRDVDAFMGMSHPSTVGALTLEMKVERVDAAVAPLTARIAAGRVDARTYVDRGSLYLRHHDRGRGMPDLEKAVEMSRRDPAIVAEYAWGQLVTNQFVEAERTVNEALSRDPDQPRALEVRAWIYLFSNRSSDAFRDAERSLQSRSRWTPADPAATRTSYRMLVGYFALRRSGSGKQAKEWLGRWKPDLNAQVWPDAAALFLLGDLDEAAMKVVAKQTEAGDHGNAVSEAYVYEALEEFLTNSHSNRLQWISQRFNGTTYSTGYSLATLVSSGALRKFK